MQDLYENICFGTPGHMSWKALLIFYPTGTILSCFYSHSFQNLEFLFLLYDPRILVMTAASVINPAFSFCSWGNRGPRAVRWPRPRNILWVEFETGPVVLTPISVSFCFQANSLYVSSSYLARKNWWPDKTSRGHLHFWSLRLYKTSKTVSAHTHLDIWFQNNFFLFEFFFFTLKSDLRFDSSVLRNALFQYFLISIYQC